MTNELFIVIVLFSVFILAITLTLIIYNNRVNKKVKNYINDKKGRPGISIPPLIYILGILAIASLIISSAIYLIPRQKLYEVNYVLYKHPESVTVVIKEDDFDLEKMIKSVIYNVEEISDSDNCSIYMKNSDDAIKITYEGGKIIDIKMDNIVIAFNSDKHNDNLQVANGYEIYNVEYKEYSVSYSEGYIVLKACLHQAEDGTFMWGPINSSEYCNDLKLFFDDFKIKHQEFLLLEEEIFIYSINEERIENC